MEGEDEFNETKRESRINIFARKKKGGGGGIGEISREKPVLRISYYRTMVEEALKITKITTG